MPAVSVAGVCYGAVAVHMEWMRGKQFMYADLKSPIKRDVYKAQICVR